MAGAQGLSHHASDAGNQRLEGGDHRVVVWPSVIDSSAQFGPAVSPERLSAFPSSSRGAWRSL
jgi:hypothetical protein